MSETRTWKPRVTGPVPNEVPDLPSAVHFAQEYRVAFWKDPENAPDRLRHTLAREYHERTEAYDQLVCREVKGVGFPNGYKASLSLQHAREIRAELLERCPWVWGIDLDRAITHDSDAFELDWRAGVRYFVAPTHELPGA